MEKLTVVIYLLMPILKRSYLNLFLVAGQVQGIFVVPAVILMVDEVSLRVGHVSES